MASKQLLAVKTRKRTALAVPRSSKPSYNKIITEKESTPEEETKLSEILNADLPSHILSFKDQDEDEDDGEDDDQDEDEDEDEDDDEDEDEDDEDEDDDEEEKDRASSKLKGPKKK